MNSNAKNIDRFKFSTMAAWFITGLLVILGYRYLKDIVTFILTKLYKLFFEQNIFRS